MSFLLECLNLVKAYQTPGGKVEALRGVSLQVKPGEFVCVTGRSGSGKTTLLNCLGTLDLPTGGSILLNGQNCDRLSEKQLLEVRRHFLGFVFQQFFLVSYLSAAENIALPLVYQGYSWRNAVEKGVKILEKVGLLSHAHQPARFLSGGEAQRVAICRAISAEPKLLLADEPTGELDTATSASVIDLLKAQRIKGIGLLIVSHDPAIVQAADRVLRLEDGSLNQDTH